jgi:hypothetical protein
MDLPCSPRLARGRRMSEAIEPHVDAVLGWQGVQNPSADGVETTKHRYNMGADEANARGRWRVGGGEGNSTSNECEGGAGGQGDEPDAWVMG